MHNIDRGKDGKSHNPENGRAAEETVINFFSSLNDPDIRVRPATPQEDSGYVGEGVGSKMIDVVVMQRDAESRREIPSMAIQVTTAQSQDIRLKKMEEMKNMPFMRLYDMKPQDTAVPRVVVFLDPGEVEKFQSDPSFERNPKLVEQIFAGVENSLAFDKLQTKNPKEQQRIDSLLASLAIQKKDWQARKSN